MSRESGTFVYKEYHIKCGPCGRTSVGNTGRYEWINGVFTWNDGGWGTGSGWPTIADARAAYRLHKQLVHGKVALRDRRESNATVASS